MFGFEAAQSPALLAQGLARIGLIYHKPSILRKRNKGKKRAQLPQKYGDTDCDLLLRGYMKWELFALTHYTNIGSMQERNSLEKQNAIYLINLFYIRHTAQDIHYEHLPRKKIRSLLWLIREKEN